VKAMMVSQHGGLDVLTLCDVPIPDPKADKVLVKNSYIGVNFVDTQHRAGLYYPINLPLIPGVEAAGVVQSVGRKVTDFNVGDHVAYAGYMGGNYAEYTAVPQGRLVPVSTSLSLDQAAAAVMTGTTAYVLTHSVYRVKAGDYVLVHAAAGGVGSALVQMAKALGATVIGTTSLERKITSILESGADEVLLYTAPDFVESVFRLTDQQGVHVVYDGVGGSLLEPSLMVLRARGHLVEYGHSGGQPLPIDITRLSGITGTKNRGSLTITWASAGDYLSTTEELRTCAAAVFDALLQGQLSTHIAHVYPLEDAAQAHSALESRATIGKLLLTTA
jgi:NADPH:quinone reductase